MHSAMHSADYATAKCVSVRHSPACTHVHSYTTQNFTTPAPA